jgi:Asp-tRNA(Asn)/Glu-tRNA(Gln) amidotransferase A subunit family amidase
MLRHFRAAVEHLREAGYWVKEMDPMPDFEDIVERHNLILAGEAAQVHQAWFSKYGDRYHERTAQLIEKGQAIGDEQIRAAKGAAREFSLRLSTLMDIHGIDLWLAPSAPGAAPKGLESTGDPIMNLPWTQAGLPALGLPFAMNKEDLPLGLQLIADKGRDEDLFSWGARISQTLAEANTT